MNTIIYLFLFSLYVWGAVLSYENEIKEIFPWEKMREISEKGTEEIKKWVVKKKRTIPDIELFKSSVILKNLSLVRKEAPMSADYIYEKLTENSGYLKPMYSQMLALYRSGRDKEAFKLPAKIIGTKAAGNFALILSKLDKLNPAELVEQMNIFQSSMIEKQVTYAVKRTQKNSVIITALSALPVFALLINFVVVVVFMDSLKMLSSIFV